MGIILQVAEFPADVVALEGRDCVMTTVGVCPILPVT